MKTNIDIDDKLLALKAVILPQMLNFLTLLTALLIADAIILILPLSLHQ